jgi:hypothetical protein
VLCSPDISRIPVLYWPKMKALSFHRNCSMTADYFSYSSNIFRTIFPEEGKSLINALGPGTVNDWDHIQYRLSGK